MAPLPNQRTAARFEAARRLERAAGHVRELDGLGITPTATETHAVIAARADYEKASR